jgi:two-component system, NtrC family, sensor kinase
MLSRAGRDAADTMFGRTILAREPVQLPDVATDQTYALREGTLRGPIRAQAAVPLMRGGEGIGAINITRRQTGEFSPEQIELLQAFAEQAVIAITSAETYRALHEALEQQTATAEVLQVINASPGDLAPVFDATLGSATRLCEAPCGLLSVYDGEFFRYVAVRGEASFVEEQLGRGPLAASAGLTWPSILAGESTVHLADARDTQQYRIGHDGARRFVDGGVGRTVLSVALRKDRVLLGVLTLYREEVRAFTDKQIALLQNFAAQAVIAMENARLLNEVRQRQEELRITFENMGDGVAMFDETQHLVAWNGKFQEVYDLPDTLLKQHRTYEEYLRFLADRGDFGAGANTAEQIHELVATTGQPYGYERTRPDGRVIEIRRNPVPDGGFVLIFSDITERKRSEVEIRAARDAAEAAYRDLKAAQASLIQAEKMASLCRALRRYAG